MFVTPPHAAPAARDWKSSPVRVPPRSRSRWVWTSTPPGSTWSPRASISLVPGSRCSPMLAMRPLRMPTSATKLSVAVAINPPRMTKSSAMRRNALLAGLQELDDRGVHLARALLLRPVAAAGQHDRASQVGDDGREIRDELVDPAEAHDQVAVAGDVERGDRHPRAGVRRQQLPVAIGVAVPVEAAAKTGASKLTGVELDIGGRDPRRQRLGIDRVVEEPASARDHLDVEAR